MAKKLNRRTFLRGVLAGGAVSVGLPPLEAFFNSNGTAYADGTAFPRRFGIFSWGNGVHENLWTPTRTGTDWDLPPLLSAFGPLQPKLTMVTGTEVKITNAVAHGSGPAGFLTGADVTDPNNNAFSLKRMTIDQMIAQQVGGDTAYRSLEVGVESGVDGMSYNGADSRNPAESDPVALFERLFGGSFRAPGDEPIIDPKLSLRRSVLDAVKADIDRLKNRVGQGDLWRLDQHFEGVRDMELRLARLESDPPSLAACARPGQPEVFPDIDGRPQMVARSHLVSDLVTMAYACDLSRVITYWYSDRLSDVLYPDASTGHHQLTHDEPGDMPQVAMIEQLIMNDLEYFLRKMDAVQEGDGTLLDHSIILCTTDCSNARTHAINEYPILIAGSGGGALNTGFHYRSTTNENSALVSMSLLRAMGCLVETFGENDAQVSQGLTALEP